MYRALMRLSGMLMLASLLISTRTWADESKQVYTGTLGKAAIVLELDSRYSEGRYFYKKYRTDLALDVSKEGDILVMIEGAAMDGDSRPTLRLQPKLNGWSGEWSNPAGKTLKVELQRATLPDVPAGALPYLFELHDKNPYEYLRLQGLQLKKGKTETFMGYTLQWWSEEQSQASLFEVISGYSPQARELINQHLMARLWGYVSGYYSCSGGYSQSSQPLWMTPTLMSARISNEFYCEGAAHPNEDIESLNFDAQTGKLLTLEDVLWVGQGKPVHQQYEPEDSSGSYYHYRTKVFAPWLVAQLLKLYPKEMTLTPEGENDCGYDEESPWQFPSWYFTDRGIKLTPTYPHGAAVCGYVDWGILPYKQVRQHPGGVALQLP
ncbi:hypothetical protein IAI51_15745 [Pseudomonas sp. N40(2020)]|uniref:hypothetical protein n=1 Tax=Pseudomonas sp. N40(2020) TaxID=2767798 RepID=UPI001656ED2F|nr:hypothetical protein [Pseudomonas sp. N40(2020)]MBC8997980.1 hypothetical protein [Pseudomonas sp. N40(2020)]